MSKLTDTEIEDTMTNEFYELLTRQSFYDFYMSKAKKSFTAHIECDNDCPTKEEILKDIKDLFYTPINKVKELVHAS